MDNVCIIISIFSMGLAILVILLTKLHVYNLLDFFMSVNSVRLNLARHFFRRGLRLHTRISEFLTLVHLVTNSFVQIGFTVKCTKQAKCQTD